MRRFRTATALKSQLVSLLGNEQLGELQRMDQNGKQRNGVCAHEVDFADLGRFRGP
jgi:hypothetical protein